MNLLIVFFYCLILILPFNASANDQELYDPKPPADASFVRFINICKEPIYVSGGGMPEQDIKAGNATNYFVVQQGVHQFAFNDNKQDIPIEPAKYYTFVMNGSKLVTIHDGISENPAKAMLYFYNFTDKPALDLYAPEHQTTIFSGIEPDKGTAREINPLKIGLAVKAGEDIIAAVEPFTLKRRAGFSIYVTGQDGKYKASVIENALAQ